MLFMETIILLVFSHLNIALSNPHCLCGVSKSSGLDICDSNLAVKITGGEEAEVNEFPWAALLEIKADEDNNDDIQRCGGTLINDRFVLTAAHCVPDSSNLRITVILGEHDTSTSLESTSLTIQAKPYGFEKHWSYKENREQADKEQGVWYDFALIELSERVDFTRHPHIRPACLPDSQETEYDNVLATVSGWGHQNLDFFNVNGIVKGQSYGNAKKLKKLDVRLMSQEKCSDIYYNVGPKIRLKESNLCAVSRSGDSCLGDSGGGLVRVRCGGRFYEIVGVVSFGVGCNSTINGVKIPGVYGRVSAVVDWVNHKTANGIFCESPLNLTGDFLYLSDSKILWLPSFQPVQGCSVPPYPVKSLREAFSGIVNNKLFICGGAISWRSITTCYTLDKGRWWLTQSLTSERAVNGASWSPTGLIITGGVGATWNKLSSTEILTPEGWVAGPPLPVTLYKHCQVYMGETVFVIGGQTGRYLSSLSSAVYALEGQSWTTLQPMKTKRNHPACSVLNNSIFVIGGLGTERDVEVYDIMRKTWTIGPELTTDVVGGQSVVYKRKLYVISGHGKVLELASDMNSWIDVANIGKWHGGVKPISPISLITNQMLNC